MSRHLRMHVEPRLRGAPMIVAFEGWNDAGEAASTAVRFIDESISCVSLAEVDAEDFFDFTVQRPHVRMDETGQREIHWPRTAFRFGGLDDDREIVVGLGIEPHFRWEMFCDSFSELVRRIEVEHVVLLGAYVADVVYSRPVDVTGFSNSDGELERLDVSPSAYEGPTGIVGVLADRLGRDGLHVTSLWAGLPHYISASPNPRGALALVQKVSRCLDFQVDDAPLRKKAAEFEEKVNALVAGDPELSEYVRQLKRREFAQ